jgi:hypothetical protein
MRHWMQAPQRFLNTPEFVAIDPMITLGSRLKTKYFLRFSRSFSAFRVTWIGLKLSIPQKNQA